MKIMLRLYGIPQFLEFPEPLPPLIYIAVPNKNISVSSNKEGMEAPIMDRIAFYRTATYYEMGKEKVIIYEPKVI